MATFHVMPSLNTDLAETNALYVNPVDATTPYVKMGRFVYKCIPHPDVHRGTVCMNAITRRAVYPSETVTLDEYLVPMTGGPKVVTAQAEYVKRVMGPMPDNLHGTVQNGLDGLVVSKGQQFTLTHEGHAILLSVTDVDSVGVITASTQVALTRVPV
jgi:hypothetical protein